MAAGGSRALTVLVTAGSEESAAEIARALVEERLAACVNLLGPIRSIYRWEGRVHDEREHLMLIKTSAARYPALQKRVIELHPYDVPEVIAFAIGRGEPRYLAWVKQATSMASSGAGSLRAVRNRSAAGPKAPSLRRSEASPRRPGPRS